MCSLLSALKNQKTVAATRHSATTLQFVLSKRNKLTSPFTKLTVNFKTYLFAQDFDNKALLLMSSGNYGGLDFDAVKQVIT